MKAKVSRFASDADALPLPPTKVVSRSAQQVCWYTWLALTDAAALLVAFRVAYWMRFDLGVTVAPDVVPDPTFYPSLVVVLCPLWALVLMLSGVYDGQKRLGGIEESARVFNACSTATMLVIVATFIWPAFVVSRMWLVSAWLLSTVAVAANRFLARRVLYMFRARGFLLTPALIVGTNEEARSLALFLGDWRRSGLRLVGLVTSSEPVRQEHAAEEADDAGLPVLGTAANIRTIVLEHDVQEVVVAITALEREELLRLSEELDPCPSVGLRLSTGLYEMLTTRVTVRNFGTVPLLQLDKCRLTPAETFLKYSIEYTLTTLGLIGLSPFLALIALLIKLDSPGPILHRRRVLGAQREPFDAFKFRTMHVNGDEVLARHPDALEELRTHQKIKDDPRVTRVGRILRKFSLDELPQLFNVLLGQMSLVGPRMIAPEEAERYGPHWMNLLAVRPGLTGLWQVSGRSDLVYEERVKLDMYYVRNYSIWLDLQILFIQTVPAVLKGRGAY
jgi:exopolysaccharide biosynthesis polyprenyl glycosylphosphotransferase